jgi:hypothetical protein
MSLRESAILFERGPFWVERAEHGYVVWENGTTHATRAAQCGYPGLRGLEWCKDEIGRRIGAMAPAANKGA